MRRKINIGALLLFFVGYQFIYSQQEDNFLKKKVGFKKIELNDNESGTLILEGANKKNVNHKNEQTISSKSNGSGIGETMGELSVSLTGGANYDIPITVPSGINGVQPNISISYDSQSGMGLAGYGWNIKGVSAITRIPSSKYHDNSIGGVNLDHNENRFALDGNRLILRSGTYGGDGAEYETEVFSNLKITSHRTFSYGHYDGPEYFKVLYPDGSIAYYGYSTDSKTEINYLISYWQNNQGIRINYEYLNHRNYSSPGGNTNIIKKISYGSRLNDIPKSVIVFEYEDISRNDLSGIGGNMYYNPDILSKIIVNNNSIKYREYNLTYNTSSLNYQRLESIQEKSGDNTKSHSPIFFDYSDSNSSVTYNGLTANLNLLNIEQRNSETRSLDLNGNGKMDFIVFPRDNKDKFWVFQDIKGGNNSAYEIPTNVFKDVFPITSLSHNNKVLSGQNLVFIEETSNQVNFKIISKAPASAGGYPVRLDYEKTWNAPRYIHTINNCGSDGGVRNITTSVNSGQTSNVNANVINAANLIHSNGVANYTADQLVLKPGFKAKNGSTFNGTATNNVTKLIPNTYVSGDFNGDGLTDIIAISENYSRSVCNEVWINPRIGRDCRCTGSPVNDGNSKVFFVDLNRNSNSNPIQIGTLSKSITKDTDKILVADFNGDGKSNILHIVEGKVFVYTLNNSNVLELLWTTTDYKFNLNLPYLLGDYNGDGLTDFLIPDVNTGNNFDIFNIRFSTGESFVNSKSRQPFFYTETNWNGSNGVLSGYNLIPIDYNRDGKTDIVEYNTKTYNGSSNGTQEIKVYYNKGAADSSNKVTFEYEGQTKKTGNLKHFPIPIFLNSNEPNKNIEFAAISDRWITSFSFTQNHREDVLLRSIENNGITNSISYNNLDDTEYTDDFLRVYQPDYNANYPNVDITSSPGTKVVTSLARTGLGYTGLKQVFSYYGAIHNMEGLGFLGFKGIAQSNWHTDGGDRIFNVSKFDTSLRGAIIEEYSQPYNFSFTSPSNIISKVTNTYSHSISSEKVFKLTLDYSSEQNTLEGTTTTKTYEYNIYNNPKTVITNYIGGDSSLVEYEYDDTPTSITNFFIGRPEKEKRTTTIDGNSFTTETHYLQYSGNLPKQIKTKGNGTQFDVVNITYDSYGNILNKEKIPFDSSSRSVSFKYDSSHRYLEESTDLEGFTTKYDYNITDGSGTLKKETNHFNQKTEYLYDSWNRLTQITDYLGNNLTTDFSESNYSYTVTELGDSGMGKITIYDPLKRVSKVHEKNALGNWVSKSYEYDAFDRLIRESEPYAGAATQWNTTAYDFYGRVVTHNNYAGKYMNIQYNGLSTTLDDGTKIITTVKNGMGHIKSVTDNGGKINYDYYGNGAVKSSNYNGNIVTIEQDGWGRKSKMTDPSFGDFTYTYNGFGELLTETSPKGVTTYTYSNIGKLETEIIQGENTDINITYSYYDSTHKQLKNITGFNARTNENYTYEYLYDNYNRPWITRETNAHAFFEHQVSRDGFGRIENETYITTNYSDNLISTVKTKNVYNSNSGGLVEILDFNTNASLWKLNSLNAKNKATQLQIGNGILKNKSYDTYGFLTNISHKKGSGSSIITALDVDYSFDHQRGNLLTRNNNVFSWSEAFNYDSLDRLLGVSGSVSYSHTYDNQGRINNNSDVGDYTYASSSSYKLKEIQLNTKGDLHYQNNPLQKIEYNAFKKPVSIHANGNGRVDFEYSILKSRSHAYYGGEQENKLDRRYKKHYSAISPVEIEVDKQGGTKIITFIGGDEYSAPIMYVKKTGANSIDGYHYLHRDYLGTILAITDSNAIIVEQRQFGAWGTVDKFVTGSSEVDFTNDTTLLNRGFTGHEHFFEVGLIHMNGRMYEAKLGRFLSPDNYIQNPQNTQNYNRYSYVLNNPLKYTDPSGEFIAEIGATLFLVVKALFVTSALVGSYSLISNLSGQSGGGGQNTQPNIKNNSLLNNATGSPPTGGFKQAFDNDRPWYVNAFKAYMDFKQGRDNGRLRAAKSSWNFVKGLATTTQAWKDLGQGFMDMAAMASPTDARGMMLRTQTATAVIDFVGRIPTMGFYEIGDHTGYGEFKLGESILLSKGTGLVANGIKGLANFAKVPANLIKVPQIPIKIKSLNLTTSSGALKHARTYTIYNRFGEVFKFGVTDPSLVRYGQSLGMAGPGAYGKFSQVMFKGKAHTMERYLRSIYYNSTGQYTLPGMKYPYPINFNTGLPIKPF
ncbi:hypothetical protein BW723_16555 [Polaribacter reichenbachii]|uniref:Insecticide toxin TcdB middle/N-terminal domain-containing protein n=1 Tax=Polaribacter reichenbachii TaxID=996801 RepID=A0A1B8TR78_9FLAO|nr:RHS repeat-associated core domain-containing protein [Polaribacter reichenbachii]APZ47808.1 hypothetical protein BW723_16555 [Polaribacter reichenbachii]AUC18443.1 hypothetical protein BTO17_06975 [Polaribacter reichenbachii]OBY62206.1 hypothetical protein LPB301_15090 [Polaribacter reichenbachii]